MRHSSFTITKPVRVRRSPSGSGEVAPGLAIPSRNEDTPAIVEVRGPSPGEPDGVEPDGVEPGLLIKKSPTSSARGDPTRGDPIPEDELGLESRFRLDGCELNNGTGPTPDKGPSEEPNDGVPRRGSEDDVAGVDDPDTDVRGLAALELLLATILIDDGDDTALGRLSPLDGDDRPPKIVDCVLPKSLFIET